MDHGRDLRLGPSHSAVPHIPRKPEQRQQAQQQRNVAGGSANASSCARLRPEVGNDAAILFAAYMAESTAEQGRLRAGAASRPLPAAAHAPWPATGPTSFSS